MDLTQLVEQVPALTVLVVVVIHFLRYLERTTTAAEKRYKDLLAEHEERQSIHTMNLKSTLETHGAAISGLASEIKASKAITAKLAQIITWHDATVKGTNTDAFGDPTDFIAKILGEPRGVR